MNKAIELYRVEHNYTGTNTGQVTTKVAIPETIAWLYDPATGVISAATGEEAFETSAFEGKSKS